MKPMGEKLVLTEVWDKTFPKSEKYAIPFGKLEDFFRKYLG